VTIRDYEVGISREPCFLVKNVFFEIIFQVNRFEQSWMDCKEHVIFWKTQIVIIHSFWRSFSGRLTMFFVRFIKLWIYLNNFLLIPLGS
jgi:hypothetical protein